MTDQPDQPDPSAGPDRPSVPADELSGLDDRVRGLVERANSEAAAFRKELRESRAHLEQLQREHESLQREHESDQQRRDRETAERIRKELDADHKRQLAEATAEHERQLAGIRQQWLAERVKVRAAGRFADPDDAALYIDMAAIGSEQDPVKRDQAIDKALDGVLERKPHLAPKDRGPLVTQGARSGQPDGGGRERSWLRG